ncbi:MAG: hypothetical protein AB7I30_22460 [Isosphaeraceae bacterium]
MIEIVVIVAFGGVFVGLALPSGDWDYTHRFPSPGPNSGNGFAAVAGEYLQGARLGRSWALSILPDGRYSFIWSGCCGVYYRESGSARQVSGHLVLWPVKPIEPQLERVFLPLKWGRRSYLIPPERLQEFCDAIIRGDEPRNEPAGDFFLIGSDDQVAGTPELPERWANYLRDNLVIGTVIEVVERGRAKVDVGSAEGVQVGSILTVQGHDRRSGKLRAVSVNDDSCEVEEVYPGEFEQPAELGWKVVMAREEKARPNP